MTDILESYRKPIDEHVGEFAESQQAFAAEAMATNFGVHEKRLGEPGFPNHQAVPHCVYFYYVRVNMDGALYITHHFYPGGDPADPNNPANPADWPEIPYDDQGLRTLMSELAQDARPTGAKKYPVIGRDFENIVWHRKSYIAIFIDEANWKLHKIAHGIPAVVFITETKDGKTGMPNHTFFDAIDLDVDMPIGDTGVTDKRTAVVFINHMKEDEAGTDLPMGPGQFFQFKMFFDVAFASGSKAMTVIFDPGGTNQGPPLQP